MKHYIYLTEDKLYYIRKENRARGYSFMGSRTITGPETVTGAMESLADIYNLKGRAVVLAIEASVKIHFMSLPASSKETVMHVFIASAGVFVTCMFPVHQFLYLFSTSHGLFSIPLRHTQNPSLPKTSSGKCSNRTGCSLPS